MLPRKNGGWRNNRDLFAAHSYSESRAQSNLSLPEAYITANKTVHRLTTTQVTKHIINGMQLIICFSLRKTRTKLIIRPIFNDGWLAGPQSALRRDDNKFACHVFEALFGFGFTRLPRHAAKPV